MMSQTTADHDRTEPVPKAASSDQSSRGKNLLDLINCLRDVANGESFVEIESTFTELSMVKEKYRASVQTIKKLETRLREAEEQQDSHTRKLLKNHREEVAAVESEKAGLSRQLLTANASVNDKEAEAVKLRNANAELNKHIEEVVSKVEAAQKSLADSQKETESLLSKVRDKENLIQRQKGDLSRQGEAIKQCNSDIKTLRKENRTTQAKLEKSTAALTELQSFARPLREDDSTEISQQFNELWKNCVTAVKSCLEKDLHESILQDPKALDSLQHSDILEHKFPLALSNSIAAKAGRCLVVLALISRFMVERIFKVTWLVEEDLDLRRELYFLAQNNRSKEGFTRALLASLGDTEFRRSYVLTVVQQVHRQVKGILDPELAETFRKDLQAIFEKAAGLWEDLQLRKSHIEVDFEINNDQSSRWKSIKLSNTDLSFTEHEIAAGDFAVDAVGVTIFPCVFTVGPQSDVPVVPGTVLQMSQVTRMQQEVVQAQKSPGSWRRTTASIERSKTTSKKRRDTLHNGETFLE